MRFPATRADPGGPLIDAIQPEVIIVDDHLTVRRGIELLLRDAGFRIAGVAGRLDEARTLLPRRHYDVALLELSLGGQSSLGLARELLAEHPRAPLVLFTGYSGPGSRLLEASELGAPGFVLSSSPPQTLIDALRTVASGATYLDPSLAALAAGTAGVRSVPEVAALSPRQREILGLLADGYSGPEIARQLFLSTETVRTHIRNALTKLGARTRVQAVAIVVREDAAFRAEQHRSTPLSP